MRRGSLTSLRATHWTTRLLSDTTMELTFLLIGVAITAGVHMMLFFTASAIAWMFYRRCKRLREQLDQIDNPQSHSHRHPDAHSSAATLARDERRQRREREGEPHPGTIYLADLPTPQESGPSIGNAVGEHPNKKTSHAVKLYVVRCVFHT